ncbi:MAG TPA: GntR family transcriptional regulator [Planctomycetota bacterium]|nr:GntR family transcriptional regulator [Planctomycetota bacterium]
MARLPRLSRTQSLVSQTEQVLRDAIRSGRFGNRLPTAVELAEQLGVSRETVRQAEAALERDGLLVKYRRKGTLLRPPALTLRDARTRVLGYLQADYAAPGGAVEAVTGAPAALMLQGALREAGRAGFQLAVRHAAHDAMDRALRELQETVPLRGVIFASFGEEKLVRQALGLRVPVVLLDHDLHLPRIGTVREDSAQGAALAVAHLAALGHRRIAYAPWRRGDLNPWRLRGYRDGLRAAGLPRRRAWELPVEITPAGAASLAARLSELRPGPTAVVCFNNTLAHLLIEALARRGVRVPQDLGVMGLGGEDVRDLACVQTDWVALGRRAVQVLLRARENAAPEHHVVGYALRKGRTAASIGAR